MEKSLQIYIAIDGVLLGDLESIAEALEKVLEDYSDKRIDIQVTQGPLVRPR